MSKEKTKNYKHSWANTKVKTRNFKNQQYVKGSQLPKLVKNAIDRPGCGNGPTMNIT